LTSEEKTPTGGRPGDRGTILVADDERSIRDMLRAVLESRGFEVIESDNGIQAVNLACERRPDLAIIDILMPGISGLEVCRRMRRDEDLHGISIIVITSVTADSELPDGFWKMATESDDFVTKPFDVFDLADRAERLVEQRRRQSRPHETSEGETQTENPRGR
jgi:DNA-binding response OmpR family regulator